MMKELLIFQTEAQARAAEAAIRNEGSRIFVEEGVSIDAQGRVVQDGTGRVLIDRYADIFELDDGRWAFASPATEDFFATRVRRGVLSRAAADIAKSKVTSRVLAKVRNIAATARADAVSRKESA